MCRRLRPDFLVVAQRLAAFARGLRALVLHGQVVGVLVVDEAQALAHARRVGIGFTGRQAMRLRRLRTLLTGGERLQEQQVEQGAARVHADRAETIDHRQADAGET